MPFRRGVWLHTRLDRRRRCLRHLRCGITATAALASATDTTSPPAFAATSVLSARPTASPPTHAELAHGAASAAVPTAHSTKSEI